MRLRIRQYGEAILREKGAAVEVFDEKLKSLIEDIVETVQSSGAAGLAAQHVGHALQICVVDVLASAKASGDTLSAEYDGKEVPLDLLMPLVLINPELKPIDCDNVTDKEGSMSFERIHVPVTRPEKVHCVFQDIQGLRHELKCAGILARCIQHEYDQAQGMLFIDRVEPRILAGIQTKLKKLKRKTRDFLKKQK